MAVTFTDEFEFTDPLGPQAQAPSPTAQPAPPPQSPLYDAANEILERRRAETTQATRKSDVESQHLAPDRAAEIRRLSMRLGLPERVVEDNFEDIQQQARLADTPYGRLQQDAPRLAAWVARDPYRFAVARPELEELTLLENTARVTGNLLASWAAGGLSLMESLAGQYQLGADLLGDEAGSESGRIAAQTFASIAERLRGDRSQLGLIEHGVYSGIESVAFAAPSVLLGLFTGGAGTALSLGTLGTQVTGQSYAEARRQGLDTGAALRYAGTQAAIEIATEKIPMARLLGDVAKKTSLVKTIARQLLPEIPGEQIATALQDLNDWASLPEHADKTFSDYLRERPSAAAVTLVATITMVGAQTTMLHGVDRFMRQLQQTASTSELAKTDPQQFAEIVNELAKDSPASEVYVRADDWTQYWQNRGEDPAAKAIELTGDATAYEQALSIGGDLAIPVGHYAAQLANTEHHEFFQQNGRLQPDMASAAELDELRDAASDVQAAVDEAAARPEVVGELSPVAQAIADQVLADPGFHAMAERQRVDPVHVAAVYAEGVSVVVGRLAARMGEDPVDTLARYNLSIGPEGTQAAIRAVLAAREQAAESAEAEGQPAEEVAVQAQDEAPPAPPEAPTEDVTLEQGPGPREPALAVAPARVQEGRLVLSTRVPTAVRAAPAAGVLRTDLEAVAEAPDLVDAFAGSIGGLPLVTKSEAKRAPDAVVEAAVQRMMRNLRWLYDAFPAAWRTRAKRWYVGAHRIAQELAIEHDISFEQAAGVLAVLSPQMDWYRNVSLAERAIRIFKTAEQNNPLFSEELFAHHRARMLDSFAKQNAGRAKTDPKGVAADRAELRAKLAWQKKQMVGRKWSDLTTFDQAVLLRAIDETTTSPAYRVITPEGDRGDFVRTADGRPARVGWGTYPFIASAIRILRDGSVETIHELVGAEHKVRSFFNNISDPWDPNSVTIDTHAVAAALLEPLAGSDPAVKQAMGGPSNRATGISGTNAVYAEAYFRLADELGILPRELQSIVWEAVRGLFTADQKKFGGAIKVRVRELWDRHRAGKLSEEELRGRLLDIAGGIRRPAWADRSPGVAFDEGRIRRGDVLSTEAGVPARRRDPGEDPVGAARRRTALVDGPVVPRPVALDRGRQLDTAVRKTAATGVLDRFRDAKKRLFESRRDRRARKDAPLTETVYTANGEFADAFAEAGFGTTEVHELRPTAAAARHFHRTISAAKAKIADGAQVYVYPVDEYRHMRLFLTPSGNAGFALKTDPSDGKVDIVSVFNHNTGGPRIGNALMALAVQLGGNKLDCFDTTLPDVYAINGFRVVRRDPWNEEFKPPDWDKARFARHNNGEPDVVYMEFDPAALKTGPITLFQDPTPAPTRERWATSRLQLAVQQAKQERASGRDWKAIVKGAKIGVNQDEFALTSFDQLDDRTQYSREEVLAYLQTYGVQIGWHVMSEDGVSREALRARTEEIFERLVHERMDALVDQGFGVDVPEVEVHEETDDDTGEVFYRVADDADEFSDFDTREEAEAYARAQEDKLADLLNQEFELEVRNQVSWTAAEEAAAEALQEEAERENRVVKYGDWQLDVEGAEPQSYREVFLQAPRRGGFAGLTPKENAHVKSRLRFIYNQALTPFLATSDLPEAATLRAKAIDEINAQIDRSMAMARDRIEKGERGGWTPEDTAKEVESVRIMEKLRASGDYLWHPDSWADGHDLYDGIENPIVRLRFNVRKALTQQPAKRPVAEATLQQLRETIESARAEEQEILNRHGRFGLQHQPAAARRFNEVRNRRERAELVVREAEPQRVESGRVLFLEEVQPPRPEEQKKMPELYTKNWRELAFKWALRYAAEEGLDGVAWTTGEQQRQRYRLSKALKRLSWAPAPPEHISVWMTPVQHMTDIRAGQERFEAFVDPRDGSIVRSDDWGQIEGQKLSEVVGPELAQRILNEAAGEVADEQLDVGGLGLKRLYDRDFPTVIHKLPIVKKHGARISTVEVSRAKRYGGRSEQPFLAITPEMQTALLQGQQTLFQEDDTTPAGKRGSITLSPDGVNIQFLKDADLSTFLHETGHLYLHIIGDLAEQLRRGDPGTWTAGQRSIVDDFDKILAWLGVQAREQIGREQHELFARGFEAYLMRGVTPNPELRSTFGRIRSWMTRIYKSIVRLNVDLSAEIVEVFDRLVATEDQIAAAQAEGKVRPVFTSAEQAFEVAGLGPIEWQGYQKLLADANEEARDALQARIMRELQREREAWWKARKKDVHAQVLRELRNQPAYRALLYLQRGERPDGSKVDAPVKIAKTSIVEKFGADRLKTLPLPYVYSVEGGFDVDAMAELLGFSSGDALLTAIAGAEKLDVVASRETDARMQAEYGNMRIDGTLRQAARAAVHTDGYQAVLTAELRALAKAARQARPIVRAAREQEVQEDASARRAMRRAINGATVSAEQLRAIADERIGKIPAKDVRPQQYWLAAQRAGELSARALEAGKYEEAVNQKQRQRMAVAMHKAAVEALDEVDALQKYAARLAKKPTQARLGKAGQSYQDQVNALLEKFEFETVSGRQLDRRQSLVDWVAAREKEGLPIDVPAEVLDRAQRVNFRSAPIEQLRDLRDTLRQIEHLARLKNQLLAAKDQRDFEAERERLVESLRTKNKQRPAQLEFRRSDERRHRVAEWFASHNKIATLAQILDGGVEGGPMWRLLVRPLNEAADREAERRRTDGLKLDAIVQKYFPGRMLATWGQKVHVPAIDASLSREAILAIALNWGNETSRDRLLNDPKRRWSRQQIEAILDTLELHEWQFVQEVWDFVDSYWQEISDKSFRVTGLRPEKVAATPVDTRHGRFRGGYYPLAYDQRLAPSPGTNQIVTDAKQQLAGAYIRATTKRGHLKSRLDHVELPVRLELGVLFDHLDQVIHDLTHHEALIDVSRMLRDRDVSSAIHDVAGDPVYRQFTSALTDIAVGRRPGTNLVDRAAAFSKTGAQVAGLGLNLWTATQQPLGLFNGAARVGPKWVLKGLFRWLRDGATMENTLVWIRDVSEFMRNRSVTQNQDIHDLRRRLQEPGGWFDRLVRTVSSDRVTQQNIVDSFLWHISLAQRVADVPTWLGMYERMMAEGKSEADAIALADQAVRDSQGGGQTVDLAQVQRGSDVARLFMTFYTYGSTTYNQTARAYGLAKLNGPVGVAKFLGELSLLYMFPAIAVVALSRALRGSGEDDDDLWDVTGDVLAEMGGIALNTMVLVRELGGLLHASNRGYQGPAGARMIQQLYNLGGQVAQGEIDEGLWHALNQTAGVVLRYPAAQAQRTIDGFIALQEGETANPLALLFGPPRE